MRVSRLVTKLLPHVILWLLFAGHAERASAQDTACLTTIYRSEALSTYLGTAWNM
jgi:hypothetical protein